MLIIFSQLFSLYLSMPYGLPTGGWEVGALYAQVQGLGGSSLLLTWTFCWLSFLISSLCAPLAPASLYLAYK